MSELPASLASWRLRRQPLTLLIAMETVINLMETVHVQLTNETSDVGMFEVLS